MCLRSRKNGIADDGSKNNFTMCLRSSSRKNEIVDGGVMQSKVINRKRKEKVEKEGGEPEKKRRRRRTVTVSENEIGDDGGVLNNKGINRKRKEKVEENRESEKKRRKVTVTENESDNNYPLQHLPEEFIIENILTRSSGVALAKCSLMSKLWYNTIFNDKRFATIHLSQNQNKLSLCFNLLNCSPKIAPNAEAAYFFSLESKKDHVLDFNRRNILHFQYKNEPVGYCNGLACVKVASQHVGTRGAISVINPTRGETLVINYMNPSGEGSGYNPLCHGFGFDSLSQEYKLVLIFTSRTNDGFLCMVFTLGTNSWRKITTTTSELSPPPGSSPFPSRMVTRLSRNFCPSASATLCGGDLFWRVTNQVLEEDDNSNKIEMLLSFDLNKEKIQLIRLPATSTLASRTANEHQHLIADHHQLVEFKGYPCIARFEKIIMNSNSDRSSCCKMHLYVLKDKVKQEWTKGETFDVQIKGLLPGFCCYFDPTTTTPPMHVLPFYDHLLLYWFDGECLTFYNLQTKHLEVVRGSRSYPYIFQAYKMKQAAQRPANVVGCGDDTFCQYMDYQLDAQVENFLSLKSFIPEGEMTVRNCADDLKQLVLDKSPLGCVLTGKSMSARRYILLLFAMLRL